jgi:EAL domain-containing protein (putative c-di-GMP-specific phosphodiesterase class I)
VEQQAQAIRRRACQRDPAEGFLFARPLPPPDAFVAHLTAVGAA